MKVELIHPPHINSTDDRLDPPLGLLYIATAIKPYCDVHITDVSGDYMQVLREADIYGITVYCCTLEWTKDIIRECRHKNPKARIILGGAHVTAMPYGWDCEVIQGYGEEAMLQMVGGRDYNEFDVDWSLVDVNSYNRVIDGEKSLPILTSRGCPYKCAFCGLSKMHTEIKVAGVKTVLEQARKIKDAGINALNVQDDIFTLNRTRLKGIVEGFAKLEMSFRCMGRAGYDTEETYKMLADNGCKGVAWGVESGSESMLDRMNKSSRVEDNYDVIQWCKKYGMDARAFIMLGFPGENRRTMELTQKFINDADPDQVFASNFIPYPGTDVWNNPEKYGITYMDNDFSQYYQVSKDGTGGAVIDTEELSREDFKELELDFRAWLKERPIRGRNIQKYEEDR